MTAHRTQQRIKTIINPYAHPHNDEATISTNVQKHDTSPTPHTKKPNNFRDITTYPGFNKRKRGTTIQQEQERHQIMQRRKKRRAAQLVVAECLRQITLPGYQRKYSPISDNKTNIPWGNHLSETKGRTHCRILFLNVNGLTSKNNYAKLFEIGEESVYNDIDIVCLVETKQNWQHKQARRSCECISKRYFNQAKFISSSAVTHDMTNTYLPGGTATIVGDPFHSRICKETSDDELGRWSAVTLKGKQER
jgi:hypothetical protein